ncbi:MAG: DEAD/DEAH box helicase, partial [Myxococcota bacterium]|nr:DEAD/DEAH box helicase [Myxococcota bacterium]
MNPGEVGSMETLLSGWRRGRGLGKHFTAMHEIPPKQAIYGDFPEALNPNLQQMLRERGFTKLYSHQAQAVEKALAGDDVVVVTPTASGKSLCYNLPVIDALYWGGNSLYMFPTKALSQDQTSELNLLLERTPGRKPDWEAQVYDGDTPPDVRRRIRRNSRLVVTNPDMLHAAILPNHKKWAAFWQNLEYVVLDELHTYRGVFGSHVANVLRRLHRVAAHYGASPTFICTSATIANPGELAQMLTGREKFALIDKNGAPSSPRTVCFLNPPITDKQQMRRQSSLSAAARVARDTIERELGTIVFARSRQSVEVLVHRLKERFENTHGSGNMKERIASYRGGYLPDLRRSIERGLREGFLLGVISTNALELGIDIGQLDVCVMAGYPGTIASTWQQIGRAGRRGTSCLAIVIATDDPLDQFIINNPEYFFAQPPEHARIDPDNLRVVVEHLKCACYELHWNDGEGFGQFDGNAVREMLEFLEAETGLVQLVEGTWRWSERNYPASEINLRNIAEENFVVVDTSHRKERVLAEVDFESAHTTI